MQIDINAKIDNLRLCSNKTTVIPNKGEKEEFSSIEYSKKNEVNSISLFLQPNWTLDQEMIVENVVEPIEVSRNKHLKPSQSDFLTYRV